jgi:hypothetical protein
MMQSEPDWEAESRPIMPELENDFEHETFPPAPVHFVPLSEKLDSATRDKLLELARAVV